MPEELQTYASGTLYACVQESEYLRCRTRYTRASPALVWRMKRFALHGVNTPALIVYVYSNYAIIYLGNIRLVGRLSPLRLYALVTADLPEAVNGGWQRAPSFPLAHDATSGASPTPHEPTLLLSPKTQEPATPLRLPPTKAFTSLLNLSLFSPISQLSSLLSILSILSPSRFLSSRALRTLSHQFECHLDLSRRSCYSRFSSFRCTSRGQRLRPALHDACPHVCRSPDRQRLPASVDCPSCWLRVRFHLPSLHCSPC